MSTTTKKEQMNENIERAKDAASGLADRAKDVAGNVADKAKDAASYVGEKAGDMASAVGEKAEGATASVGSGIQSLGRTVREKGPESGFAGRAAEGIACALEDTGRYLEEKNLSGMADDLTGLIRRNPITALLVGVGVGFLLARTFRS